MTTDELAALLREIAERVELGDSWEGFIEYLIADDDELDASLRNVRARFRVGNRGGQGGYAFIGELKSKEEIET